MIRRAHGYLDPSASLHLEALRTSSELTNTWRRMYRPMAANVTPEQVIEALNDAGVRFVLMGTHGVGGYRSAARATKDVDVLVTKRDIRRAVRALRRAYPDLPVSDFAVVTRFIDPATGEGVIDVMKPVQAVYQMAFRQTVAVGETHRIPNLEMALISKFAAMTSPRRDADKKMLDGADFINIVRHNRAVLDQAKLVRLAERVYRGGGAEIRKMIEEIDAGRTIHV